MLKKRGKDQRPTYIGKIVNKSSVKTVLILPFRESLLKPTATRGYILRSESLKNGSIAIDRPLFIGTDVLNSGILVATADGTAKYTPSDFKKLDSHNTLTIEASGKEFDLKTRA